MSSLSSPERIAEEEEVSEQESYSATPASEPITRREERVVRRSKRATASWDELFTFDQDSMRRTTGLIVLAFAILNGLILLRFMLKLMAANPANAFASFIYTITAPFLWVFQGLTTNPSFAGITIEFHDLIAVAVYAGLAWVIVRLIWLLFARFRA